MSVLLSHGDGLAQPAVNYGVGAAPIDIGVADFNSDGLLDLAVANQNSSNVSVLMGNGNGMFQAAVNFAAMPDARALTIGDMNDDGRPDIVVTHGDSNQLSTLLGDGDGSFQAASSHPAVGSPRGVAVGDFNNDGSTDIVVANWDGNSISVLMQVATPSPVITQQPVPASVFSATTATFTVAATSGSALTYQWRRNGLPLSDAPTGTGSVITGVTTPMLTISYAAIADSGGAYDCIFSDACVSTRSDPAGLRVTSSCPADFNESGTLNVPDIFAFLSAWFAGCP